MQATLWDSNTGLAILYTLPVLLFVALLIFIYIATHSKKKGLQAVGNVIGAVFSVVFFIGFVALIVGVGYEGLDDKGWIPHEKVVSVFLKPNTWIAGEYKDCYSVRDMNATELTTLYCGGENDSHDLKVKFWGKPDPDKQRIWKCQRLESRETSLTCKLR